jgi:signal transduction histidine kinase
MNTGRWSLHKRVLGIALASCLVAWVAGGAAVYLATQREEQVLFDARLSDLANTLLVFADHEIREIESANGQVAQVETLSTAQGRYRYQIWTREGRLLMSSANAPRNAPLMPLTHTGLATLQIAGEDFRVVGIAGPEGRYCIQAAEPLSARLEVADLFSRYLVMGGALSALLLGGLGLVLMRLALRPVRQAAAQMAQRGPSDLRAVDLANLPDEFAPLLAATNHLMQRVDVALRSEREFVAAAAHELRTPLAGLHAQALLAAHARTTDAERHQALADLREGVDHAAHLVNQLLDLARSDTLAGDQVQLSAQRMQVNLHGLLERTMSEIGPQAAARDQQLHQILSVDQLLGSDFGIGLIVRNLLANAVAHAPKQGQVAIGTRREGAGVLLWVEDSGDGVAPEEHPRLFERFYRVRGNDRPGCGLGLSIVKALADAHGATLSLGQASLGGLRVEVWFPDQT